MDTHLPTAEAMMTDSARIQCSPAIAVLCFHLPPLCADLTELLNQQDDAHVREHFEVLAAYCDYGYLKRFEALDSSTRKLVYECIVACCRANIGKHSPGSLRTHHATIVRSIHDCRGQVYVYGLAKKHPSKKQTWRDDARDKLSKLQNMLNRVCVFTREDAPRPPSPPSSPTQGKEQPGVRSLLEVLEALAADYPHRLVVLRAAFESAEKASDFRSPEQADVLMRLLVKEYLPRFEARGDEYARRVFTNNQFAANESKTTRTNGRSLKAHTFDYQGEAIVCWKHLRIGNGESSQDCWRCYFYHDEVNGKIVIAHCGAHLELG